MIVYTIIISLFFWIMLSLCKLYNSNVITGDQVIVFLGGVLTCFVPFINLGVVLLSVVLAYDGCIDKFKKYKFKNPFKKGGS